MQDTNRGNKRTIMMVVVIDPKRFKVARVCAPRVVKTAWTFNTLNRAGAGVCDKGFEMWSIQAKRQIIMRMPLIQNDIGMVTINQILAGTKRRRTRRIGAMT